MITFGKPGIAPMTTSSMLGCVAAVMATESPSQLNPAVIQSTSTASGGRGLFFEMATLGWVIARSFASVAQGNLSARMNPSQRLPSSPWRLTNPWELLARQHEQHSLAERLRAHAHRARGLCDDFAD